jgi:4-hydroxyphenylacetate 3-monooxygenase
VALSSFGARQVLYERFFFGDPVRMQMATFGSYDRQPYANRVREFLAREGGAASPAAPGVRARASES